MHLKQVLSLNEVKNLTPVRNFPKKCFLVTISINSKFDILFDILSEKVQALERR